MKVNGQFFETRADAARLLQPANALLNDVPLAIGLFVKLDVGIVPGMFVVLMRNDGLDSKQRGVKKMLVQRDRVARRCRSRVVFL